MGKGYHASRDLKPPQGKKKTRDRRLPAFLLTLEISDCGCPRPRKRCGHRGPCDCPGQRLAEQFRPPCRHILARTHAISYLRWYALLCAWDAAAYGEPCLDPAGGQHMVCAADRQRVYRSRARRGLALHHPDDIHEDTRLCTDRQGEVLDEVRRPPPPIADADLRQRWLECERASPTDLLAAWRAVWEH